jgi:MFS family permease
MTTSGAPDAPRGARRERVAKIQTAIATTAGSIRAAINNPDILRIQGSWSAGIAGDWVLLVALLVVAFETGGALAVGLLGLVRMLPSTLIAPLAGIPAARYGSARVLVAVNLIRAASALGCAVAVAVDAPIVVAFALATVAASAGAMVRPVQTALLPSLARTPEELVAGNSVSSLGEAAGTFVGPLVGGILVVAAGPGPTLAAAALLFALAALPVSRLDAGEEIALVRALEGGQRRPSVLAGLRALQRRPGPALIVVGFMSQVFVRGLLVTLLVVASVELLGMGDAGVGWLNAAVGAGGLLGALTAAGLGGRISLSRVFAVSLVFWGLPIALFAGAPIPLVALAALFVTGLSNASLDVAGFTILQRSLTLAERVPVFGLFEGGVGVMMAVGGIVAPILIAVFGSRGALLISGAILPVVALVTWPRIRHIERESMVPPERLRLVRSIPLFAPLNLSALERLASAMTPVSFEPGEVLMREGEPGDRYLVIESGAADVSQGGQHLRVAGTGEGIGEIALLRDVPRTATVVARQPIRAYALDARSFKGAMAGPSAWATAEAVMAGRFGAAGDASGPHQSAAT